MALVMAVDFRSQDRRRKMPFLCAYHLGIKAGRRRLERRFKQREPAYVDYYPWHMMFIVVGILILGICDIFFTLKILASGGEELNWFMAILLEENVSKFVAVKLALTSLALVLMVVHHRVHLTKYFCVRHLIYMVLVGYGVLMGYELYLLTRIFHDVGV